MKKSLEQLLLNQQFLINDRLLMLLSLVFGWSTPKAHLISHYLEVTGMQHVAAASGFNVGLVIGMAQSLISRFSPAYRFLILELVTLSYFYLTNQSPAVLRATCMASLSLAARLLLKRQYSPWRALCLTAAVLVVADLSMLESISFQLSVAATAGILIFCSGQNSWAQALTGQLTQKQSDQPAVERKILKELNSNLSVTVAAQVLTLPLVFYHFGEWPTISLIANTILLALIPSLTKLGFIVVILLVLSYGGGLLTLPARLTSGLFEAQLLLLERGLLFFGTWQWPEIELKSFNLTMVLASWLGVVILSYFIRLKQRPKRAVSCWEVKG